MSKREPELKITAEEIQRIQKIIKEVRAKNDKEFVRTGKQKTYYITTFGCQMNAHDSEKLIGMVEQMGYTPADKEKEADFILYNTCCVRENAEHKVFGKLGALKHVKARNNDLKIVLCGCMMQQEKVLNTIKQKYRHVDLIFGTFNLYKFPELFLASIETSGMIIDIWKEHKEIMEDLPSIRKYKFKACVNIMYGCNNFCTYCIVPFVRGRERSRSPEDIVQEIKDLVQDGVKEIMLLGQNVNSYGKNLEDQTSFAELLYKINEVEGLERIRFMTSHPKDLSDELIEAMRSCEKVCKHLHLPIQAGSTKILTAMNRKYTKEEYTLLARKIQDAIPGIALTTDIIVGFPGETEEDFQDTLDILKEIQFHSAYTFLYSIRSGTPAATMDDQVIEEVAQERFSRLLGVLNPIILTHSEALIGKTIEVLVEEVSKQAEGILAGRSDQNHLVHFAGKEELIGQIVSVKIIEAKTFYVVGEKV